MKNTGTNDYGSGTAILFVVTFIALLLLFDFISDNSYNSDVDEGCTCSSKIIGETVINGDSVYIIRTYTESVHYRKK